MRITSRFNTPRSANYDIVSIQITWSDPGTRGVVRRAVQTMTLTALRSRGLTWVRSDPGTRGVVRAEPRSTILTSLRSQVGSGEMLADLRPPVDYIKQSSIIFSHFQLLIFYLVTPKPINSTTCLSLLSPRLL